jgi:hypothetical protein
MDELGFVRGEAGIEFDLRRIFLEECDLENAGGQISSCF